MEKYSVLMSVYHKELPDNLSTSMDSMFSQTVSPDEFILMCDGPLTDELNAVIRKKEREYPNVLRVIRLKENVGLGKALQIGLKKISNEIVARMDSDDISLSDRCEKQLTYLEEHPDVSIVGGAITEFETDPSIPGFKRVVPENHEEIVEFSKSRNPFNHMSVMYRKSHVLDAGGYKHLLYLEDYYLWIRMFINGYKGHNLTDTLVYARVGNGMLGRRSGMAYAKLQKRLFAFMLKNNYITKSQYINAVISRTVISVCPGRMRQFLYEVILRS